MTYVLVMLLGAVPVVIPGYHYRATCEAARQEFIEKAKPLTWGTENRVRGFCVTGAPL